MKSPMSNLAQARKGFNKFHMKCIVPDENGCLCGKQPISSHSIQHRGILSRLAEEGKICVLVENTRCNDFFEYDIKNIGISTQASIFRCLCKEHDKQLFADIEDRGFNNEGKQYFEYALKAILYTYWTKSYAANSGPIVTRTMEDDQKAYADELKKFWEIRDSGHYENLLNWKLEINGEIQCAISTSINICRQLNGKIFGDVNRNNPLLHFSVFPSERKSYILISCLKENQLYFDAFIDQFNNLSEKDILKCFNILFPLLTENIMISPRKVQVMSDKAKKELLTIFDIKTLYFYYKIGVDILAWSKQVSYSIF